MVLGDTDKGDQCALLVRDEILQSFTTSDQVLLAARSASEDWGIDSLSTSPWKGGLEFMLDGLYLPGYRARIFPKRDIQKVVAEVKEAIEFKRNYKIRAYNLDEILAMVGEE